MSFDSLIVKFLLTAKKEIDNLVGYYNEKTLIFSNIDPSFELALRDKTSNKDCY